MREVLLMLLLSMGAVDTHAGTPVTIVSEDDWYPYAAARNGQAEGFAVDVVKAAYAAAGVDLTLKTMPYARCMEMVKQGEEIGCFDTSLDPTTQNDYLFHKTPLFDAQIGIYAKADFAGEATVASMEGKKVGLTTGYTYGDAVEKNDKIMKETASTDKNNIQKLIAGRVDFTLLYTKVADAIIAENKAEFSGKLKQVGVASNTSLYISFSKTNAGAKQALELFDQGMEKIKADGTYSKIESEWNTKLKQ